MVDGAVEEYDCVACGRCCFHGANYVQVFEEDYVRLGPVNVQKFVVPSTLTPAQRRPGEDESTRFMRMEGGHCAALSVEPGRYACTIYEQRPILCEVFAPGSPSCLEARARPTQQA